MSADTVHDLTVVWQEVRQWPARQRLVLATRILQSLEQEPEAVSVSKERKEALNTLIGIWRSVNPPTDKDVEKIIEEGRMKKYG